MPLIRYNGVILKRDGSLATSLNCCCDQPCNCCDMNFYDYSIPPLDELVTNHNGNFGNTVGELVDSIAIEETGGGTHYGDDGYSEACLGKIEFTYALDNGACQERETMEGRAYLRRAEKATGYCCYWEITFDEPYSQCLLDGFPVGEIALIPFCQGASAPTNCDSLLPIEPCYGICNTGGFDLLTFKTNVPGNCTCPGDTYFIELEGGSEAPDGGGGSSPP